MDTEFLKQALFSDLCDQRVSGVNLLGLTFMTVGILNHRGTMDTEFSEQALFSDLGDYRVSVVNLLGLLAQKKVRAFRPAPWKIQV